MGKFKDYIRETLSLEEHLDREAAIATIRKNVAFAGPNVIILACAIIIASIGLNVNSIPVIIGAMLISPVMGPIIGFGLSIGTNDMNLLKSSFKNFAVMVAISIIASTLYFLTSPLNLEHPTELLARTRPTIYDVLIALFSGVAGMLEHARKERGSVISGVAIATALMPPLCTVGYGIANLSLQYIVGALYLFIINSVFIVLATFIMVKYLEFPVVRYENAKKQRSFSRLMYLIIILMIAPSIYTAVVVIKETNFTANAGRFVDSNKTLGSSYIYDHDVHLDKNGYSVEVFLAGDALDDVQRDLLLANAEKCGLQRNQVVLREAAAVKRESSTEMVRDLYEYYDKRIQELTQVIIDLEVELAKYRKDSAEVVPKVDSTVLKR